MSKKQNPNLATVNVVLQAFESLRKDHLKLKDQVQILELKNEGVAVNSYSHTISFPKSWTKNYDQTIAWLNGSYPKVLYTVGLSFYPNLKPGWTLLKGQKEWINDVEA